MQVFLLEAGINVPPNMLLCCMQLFLRAYDKRKGWWCNGLTNLNSLILLLPPNKHQQIKKQNDCDHSSDLRSNFMSRWCFRNEGRLLRDRIHFSERGLNSLMSHLFFPAAIIGGWRCFSWGQRSQCPLSPLIAWGSCNSQKSCSHTIACLFQNKSPKLGCWDFLAVGLIRLYNVALFGGWGVGVLTLLTLFSSFTVHHSGYWPILCQLSLRAGA